MTGVLAEVGAMIVGLDQLTAELLVSIRDPALTKIMNSVTGLGSATAAAVIVGLLYLAEWYEEVATSVLALGLTGPVVLTLMGLVQRPFPPNPVCVTGGEMVAHSFPSGHAAGVHPAIARDLPTGSDSRDSVGKYDLQGRFGAFVE